ncbi:MAG TPA: N-acetylglucosamine-6-phosphate deacetylase [Terriglobales bacterium]|nr:N-acetylglucosamine-6-phosphate deacetylase [Terriglobales bacterium]
MIEALVAATALLPDGPASPGVILVEDGMVVAAGARGAVTIPTGASVRDFGDTIMAPGMIDLHVHGGAGHDFMSADSAALAAVRRHLARHGVTRFLATTVSAPWDATLAAVERLSSAGLSLHLEGPFLSPARRGVHPVTDLLLPTLEKLDQLWEASAGHIALITVAPELAGAPEFIAAASARGIALSMGHSDADWRASEAGQAAGARSITHTFNAMPPLDHRSPGLLGFALSRRDLYAEIIADGIHVAPEMVDVFLRAKGRDRALLVSDGISATGCGDGRFRLGPIEVDVAGDACRSDGRLAGSVLTLDQAVRNVMRFAGWPLADALQLATANPARLLGSAHHGRLAPGAAADCVVLTSEANIVATLIAGRQVD